MYAFIKDSKAVCVFLCTEPGAPIIYLNTFSNEGQKVYGAAQATGCPLFSRAKASTGLHIFLPGEQGEQNQKSSSAERQAEHGRAPFLLSGQGDRNGVSAKSG